MDTVAAVFVMCIINAFLLGILFRPLDNESICMERSREFCRRLQIFTLFICAIAFLGDLVFLVICYAFQQWLQSAAIPIILLTLIIWIIAVASWWMCLSREEQVIVPESRPSISEA